MKGTWFFLALLIPSPVSATWSVIALDRESGTVVIASATCVAQSRFSAFPAEGLKDIQAIVVPGVGVAAAQAGVDRTRANQRLIFSELRKGTAPADVIELLSADPEIERRQFALLDVQGQIEGSGIHYSIQGNILASDDVVRAAVRVFADTEGSLTDRVMAAMEAADAEGGDGRCTCETEPKSIAPCHGKTAHVAYLLRAESDDTTGRSFNDGDYSLFIDVTDENIRSDEDANPVRTLRMRYDALMAER